MKKSELDDILIGIEATTLAEDFGSWEDGFEAGFRAALKYVKENASKIICLTEDADEMEKFCTIEED
jgi:hypothetical protein